ncbi:carboxylesterase 1D isoform X1 [Ictalurus punctatus]|uniref:Carboxylesterase 1D isoform X1 n=1 Tax=Ictalurus punctatus TaxID=7998 RepID=A0A2D0SF10_ICTPU|nr:carboxylesterase 1D isoform X1 [Ictalurus punctatus]
MGMFTVLLWSFLGVNIIISATANDGPVVQTKYGALKGEYLKAKGKDTLIHSYLGVPFAKPPVGPLRLSAPQPAEQWQGVRDAAKQPNMCVQNREQCMNILKNFSMTLEVPEVSEDCLYLNIYTPAKPSEDTKLPVMVWIHGGGLSLGSASVFDGHALAAYQNVVVVLIQYRLGFLGFFSTGDELAPGNYGLLDQVAALQWVQENIHSFGGDPGSVTIFGESAGGVSVSYHILAPLSAGLFRYAIAGSGTAAMDAIFTTSPLPVAQYVANASGCDTSSTKQIADCVMRLSEEDLLTIAKKDNGFFKVTTDGRFLPKSVDELLQNKEFSKVPFITGVTDDEGGFGLLNFLGPPGWAEGLDREQVMSLMPFFFPDPSEKWLHEIVVNEYLGTTNDRIEIRDGFREMCGDILFNLPTLEVAKHHKDSGAPVYLYEFQHTFNELKKKKPSFVGSDHGDELHFVFGSCFLNGHLKIDGQFTEEENKLCRTIMAYWGNFARTGSPNGPGLTPWPEFGAEAEYLGIGLEQKPGKNLKEKHYAFLTQTLSQLRHEKKKGPVVQTKYGALKGEHVTAKGKDTVVYSYLGVPFAKPPVGPLRFTAPQPAEQWKGVRDATKQPYMCIQNRETTVELFSSVSLSVEIPEVSEDCLYLNIYTPAKPGEDAKLPVMVWIHGGGLTMGSASICDGSALSAYQNVVVVLIQYRLGLFGFFSTGDEHAPGNYGLLDQVAALQWVQENIHSFGGDPGSVTIFGESAGGASVSFLLLSPLSAGLFHRAIAESGTATLKGIVGNPLPIAKLVANISGCDISSTQKIAECIKHWSIEDVISLSKERMFLQFVVTVDKIFLPKPVEELLQNQEFHKVPLMTGVNNDEFGWVLPRYIAPSGWNDGMDKEQVLSSMAAFSSEPQNQWINELVVEEYLGSSTDPIKIRDGYKEMMGDLIFTIPALTLAKAHKGAGAPIYLYEFQHTPSVFQATRPSFVGCDHGDELAFVFGLCFGNAHVKVTGSFTKEEDELCRTVMAYWGNFARTGSPNGPGLTPWPEFGAEAEYLGIGLEQKPGKNLKAERYIFMTEKLPELVAAAQEKGEHVEL